MIYSNEKTLGIFEDYIDITCHLDWLKKFKNRKVFYFINIQNKSPQKIKIIELLASLNIRVLPAMKYNLFPCDFILADPQKINEQAYSNFSHNESFIYLWNKHNDVFTLNNKRKSFVLFTTYKQLDDFMRHNKVNSVQFSSRYFPEFVFIDDILTLSVVGNSLGYVDKIEQEILEKNILGVFNSQLPCIAIINDGLLREKCLKETVKKLSIQYNVFVLSDTKITFDIPNVLCVRKSMAPFVTKIAKVNLVSIYSEELVNYLIQGIPTIPIYTRYIDTLRSGGHILPYDQRIKYEKKRFISFTELFLFNNTANEFLMYFNPIDLEDTKFLNYHIKNDVYWKKFIKEIDMICNRTIGMHFNNIKKTSDTIIKILKHEDLKIVRKIV